MSVAAALSHAPSAHAPAPAAPKAQAPQAMHAAPQGLVSSLSSVPIVQRKCAGCSGEDEHTMVQPRLEVGAVNDPFEREADAIAGKVMAMRDPGAASVAAPHIQRACASCGGHDERVRRSADPMAAMQIDPEDKARMKGAEIGTGAGESINASAHQLTTGGTPLPDQTRDFFEARMGRDLSGVRVHEGAGAQGLNTSIAARAFAYKNHIWLNRGERADTSFTMAHELAHVLQQTQPGPVAPGVMAKRAEAKVQRKAPDAFTKIFGSAPYWEAKTFGGIGGAAKENAGQHIHKHLLPAIAAKDPLLKEEISIPMSSTRSKKKSAIRGRPDLYSGTDMGGTFRRIGVNFRGTTITLPRSEKAIEQGKAAKTKRVPEARYLSFTVKGSKTRNTKDGRPWLKGAQEKQNIQGLREAPVDIRMGDLKPISRVKKGEKELAEYQKGITRTRKFANQLAMGKNPSFTEANRGKWEWPDISFSPVKVSDADPQGISELSGERELAIYDSGGFRDDEGKFKRGTLIHEPPTPVKGKLRSVNNGKGVYTYFWELTTTPLDAPPKWSLTEFATVSAAMKKALISKTLVPIPAPPKKAPPKVAPKRSANVKPIKNVFDKKQERKWNKTHKGMKRAFREPEKDAVVTNYYMAEIDNALPSQHRQGIAGKLKGKKGKQVQDYKNIQLMTAPFAPVMSKGRRLFGKTFEKVSRAYKRIKTKFSARTRGASSPKGGGMLGALIKVALKVMLLIGRQIVAGTMIALNSRLGSCLDSFLEDFFAKGSMGEMKERFENFNDQTVGKLEKFINQGTSGLSEKFFGPYAKDVDATLKKIEGFTKAAGPILTAYNVVRWGIQAVACATPPVVGCLWGLARSAIEWGAAQVMQTCWFMKKITPYILEIDAVKNFIGNTSNTLSAGILTKGGELLPDPIGTFFTKCGGGAPKVAMPPAQTVCEEGGKLGNSPKPSPEAIAFWERFSEIPEEKQEALKKLMIAAKVKQNTQVDWDKLNDMLDYIEGVTAAELETAAKMRDPEGELTLPEAIEKIRKAAETGKPWRFKKRKKKKKAKAAKSGGGTGSGTGAKPKSGTAPKAPSPGGTDTTPGGGQPAAPLKQSDNDAQAKGPAGPKSDAPTTPAQAQEDAPKHWLETGEMPEEGTRSLNVNISIWPRAGTVFKVGNFTVDEHTQPDKVWVQITTQEGDIYGPEAIEIFTHAIEKFEDGYRIAYAPIMNYLPSRKEGGITSRLGLSSKLRGSTLEYLKEP